MKEGFYLVKKNGSIHMYSENGFDDDLDRSSPPKDKWNYPYSYDPHTVWGDKSDKITGSIYTDRLQLWDTPERISSGTDYQTLQAKHFPDGVRWSEGHNTEAFLKDYFNNTELKLYRVVEHCNVSNGYPLWLLLFNNDKA